MFSAGETVTVIRPANRDILGDRTAAETTHTIAGCAIAQASTNSASSTSEVTDRRETTVSHIELLCPPGANIRSGDYVRFTADGPRYQVDGQPWQPHNPFT